MNRVVVVKGNSSMLFLLPLNLEAARLILLKHNTFKYGVMRCGRMVSPVCPSPFVMSYNNRVTSFNSISVQSYAFAAEIPSFHNTE